jgi:hypothetical protein
MEILAQAGQTHVQGLDLVAQIMMVLSPVVVGGFWVGWKLSGRRQRPTPDTQPVQSLRA